MEKEKNVLAFLDANIFISGRDNSNSPSFMVINKAIDNKFKVVVSDLILAEVSRYFAENYGRDAGWLANKFICSLPDIKIIIGANYKSVKEKYKLREADAYHLATALSSNADYFVTIDSDFFKLKIEKPRVIRPEEFIQLV